MKETVRRPLGQAPTKEMALGQLEAYWHVPMRRDLGVGGERVDWGGRSVHHAKGFCCQRQRRSWLRGRRGEEGELHVDGMNEQ